jgi:MFS family permease
MILGFFGSVYLNWVYLTWLPGYLEIERHMSTFGTGFAAAIPFFCGFVGSLVAGWFSDLLTQHSTSPVRGRKTPVVVAMLGMALFTVPAALVQSNVVALACISGHATNRAIFPLMASVPATILSSTASSAQNFSRTS